MIRALYRISLWLRRLVVVALLAGVLLGGPPLYVETQCLGGSERDGFASILPDASRRPEAATYLGFPRDYIAQTHAEYAAVAAAGEPHDFAFVPAVAGFWQTLCPLAGEAAARGGFQGETKRETYLLGAGFTAGMLAKAAYEETAGRLMTMARGAERAPLDDLSAEQAAAYAAFLRQVPWHRWNFGGNAAALADANSGAPRDWERMLALNVEYRAKGAAAWLAARVNPGDGIDALSLRMVVTGAAPEALSEVEGVTVVGPAGEGTEIETARGATLAPTLLALAGAGAEFADIAGNDDILISVLSPQPAFPGALRSMPRQGFGDHRHLLDMKVWSLAARLRQYSEEGVTLEAAYGY